MPLITVTYASPSREHPAKASIASEVARLSAAILGKDPAVTAVIVQDVPPQDWFCGGRSLADAGVASVWIDIHITESTNTKDEKARFIAATYSAMAGLFGSLHKESYIHVHEVRDDAYGFGGLTQEQRYIARKLSVPAAAA
jgi:4-oxalocrotonate tautomerase